MNRHTDVECCFCGERIAPRDFDPCQLSLVTHVLRSDREPSDEVQDFFCHADCFRERLATNARQLASLIDPGLKSP
jgi:hypothetical protein